MYGLLESGVLYHSNCMCKCLTHQLSQFNSIHSLTGVKDEAAELVKALTMNTELQKAFIALLQRLPDNNLLTLSNEVECLCFIC